MKVDTLIVGAGAAGLMAAAHCGGSVLVVDHAKKAGDKIRISGGGRCNFTNLYASPENFLSQNPHFCKSALARYTQWDFIDLVTRHGIAYHEKTLGQLFCNGSAKEIIAMLMAEMEAAKAQLWLQTSVTKVQKTDQGFSVALQKGDQATDLTCTNLIIATGGKSIPKMGATGWGYDIAAQFGLEVVETRAGLVPLTFGPDVMADVAPMSGLSLNASVQTRDTQFEEGLLCTHRGLSGPSILQISSYWTPSTPISVNLDPKGYILPALRETRQKTGKRAVHNVLADHLPTKLAQMMVDKAGLAGNLADQSDSHLARLEDCYRKWMLTPSGTEGYRTAEVTLGGVSTADLNSQTMQAKDVNGLYFIGEVVDVTGWLGGFNFQWAWSSAVAAGRAIKTQSR
ncbi:NAD(P)/FAD-dependent oxidoreductase [Algirhabdus cladophorae]|uniref:NAD(P)/FAD-dependent oxidoreductase n=1 Tax=Algirhabdus cladophorae TaxID=3377108 RepID=UPI003B84582C